MTDYMALKDDNSRLNDEERFSGKTRLRSLPLSFSLDLNGKCTLKCMHCGCHLHGRSSNKEMSEEVYNKVISSLMPTAYKCHLGGGNYGEVTIAKHFHQFLKDCEKYQVRINLTTNGTIIKDKWLDDLLKQLVVVGFSLEGLHEKYEEIRRFKWSKFIGNVQKLCDRREQLGLSKSFRTEWRYCAHAGSIHQLPQMIRLAKDIGIDRIQIMPLTPYVESQRYKNLDYHRSLANQYFEEGRVLARELEIDVKIPQNYNTGTFDDIDKQDRVELQKESMVAEIPHCYVPWQSVSINENGFVHVCHLLYNPYGTIGHPLGAAFRSMRLGSIGAHWDVEMAKLPMNPVLNMMENSFDDVWNGWQYRLLRTRINTKSPKTCFSCRHSLWDSRENLVFSSLESSLLDALSSAAKKAMTGGRKMSYRGEVPWTYSLLSER